MRLSRARFFCFGKITLFLFIALLMFLSYGLPVNAYVAPVTTDLWDIRKDTQVTNTSGVYPGSDIKNMFGGAYGSLEVGHTVFQDNNGLGYTHYVEWQTPTAILLTGFNLIAAHDDGKNPDGSQRDITYRGFRDFILQAWIGGTWTNIYSYHVSGDTYNPGLVDGRPYNELALYVTGLNAVAQKFRAEFGQAGNVAYAQGPRIIELDGFGSPVPVPPTVYLLGAGLVGLVGLRRKFRK